MAEIPVEKLDEQLNCTVCLDTFTDPKILQCFHVYCQKCLEKLVIQDQQGQLSLTCPTCRQVTPLSDSGTAGLQSAFHVNRLLEIVKEHRKVEQKENCKDVPQLTKSCSEHADREIELFCETCDELICYKCAIKDGEHQNHSYKNINESFEQYKSEVEPSLDKLVVKMTNLSKILTQLDSKYEEVTNQQVTIANDVKETGKQLHKIIDARQNELLEQLDQITKKKLQNLAAQRDKVGMLRAQLSSCFSYTSESLKTGNQQHQVLILKKNLLQQLKELTNQSQPDICIDTGADVTFSASPVVEGVCQYYGKIYEPISPDPAKCQATGKGTEEAEVGQQVTVMLEATSYSNELCDSTLSFEAQIVSEITGAKEIATVEFKQLGEYAVRYQPNVKGRHKLHIKTDGQHISNSPLTINVKLPVEKLGNLIQTLDNLLDLWGIAVSKTGEVMVAEPGASRVSVFSPGGKKLRSFPSSQGCSGITIDGKGNVFATDLRTSEVRKFTADGKLLKVACGFSLPNDVAYSAHNNKVYVVDRLNNCVQILTSDLTRQTSFGKKGSSKGQFDRPRGIATDQAGRVYVADSDNYRVQVFTAEGKYLRMFGKKGAGRGELDWPAGIAVDASGFVYVTEFNNNRVSVFTSDGKFVTCFGKFGSNEGELRHPYGVAVDSCGVVFVCDGKNDRVQMF